MTDLRTTLIEAGADAVDELPYDTLELRNWGEEGVADPYRIVSEAVIDRLTETGVEDECPWCAGDGYWEEPNPLPGYSPGPAPTTCPYCKGIGRVLVIPADYLTEEETK